jgi:hypothetical protein
VSECSCSCCFEWRIWMDYKMSKEWDVQVGSSEMKDVDREYGCTDGKVSFGIFWDRIWYASIFGGSLSCGEGNTE